jgi:hypothetical protein
MIEHLSWNDQEFSVHMNTYMCVGAMHTEDDGYLLVQLLVILDEGVVGAILGVNNEGAMDAGPIQAAVRMPPDGALLLG